MEGIIMNTLQTYPMADVIMMHFIDPPKLEVYKNGGVPDVIRNHEKVAEHYRVNSIHLAKEVSDRILAAEFNWEDDFKDLHPSVFGHDIYARSIIAFLDNAWAKVGSGVQNPIVHSLPDMLDRYSYTHGKYLNVNQAVNIRNWNFTKRWSPSDGVSTRKRYVEIPAVIAEVAGAEMRLEFTGKAIGICIASGPDAGMIVYSIDGAPFQKIDLFTEWSSGLHLPWYVMLNDELKNERHSVMIRTISDKNAKSKGNACRVLHFLVNNN